MLEKVSILFYIVLFLSLFGEISYCTASINGTRSAKFFLRNHKNTFFKMWRSLTSASRNLSNAEKSLSVNANLTALPFNLEGKMNSVQIIVNRGYPVASYSVITDDGYILELHRIPRGKNQQYINSNALGKPVFLQHGVLGSSADWITGPSNRALGFRLADQGYDVWLGNARGNTYSRKHKTMTDHQRAYWNFSWDEMAKFDIPAVINYILSKTGRDKLIYIGYSMGCSMFFASLATHPELNSKIDVMVGMAPAVSLAHLSSPVIKKIAPFVKHIEFLLEMFQTRSFLANDSHLNAIQRKFCRKNFESAGLCRNILFALVGDDADNIELELLPVLGGNVPAGTSVRTIAQFAMNRNSGSTFIPYDFGLLGNLRHYGKFRPPPYDLSKITVPVYLFYGHNDLLVRPEDVQWLASKLPNVKETIQVGNEFYNHASFLWGKHNNPLIYDKLISFLPPPN